MNAIERIAKNIFVFLISQMTGYTLNFFFFMYTARYLGSEGFGMLSFALAFAGIFGIFADLGLQTLTIREIARNPSIIDKYITNIFLIKTILSIVLIISLILIINIFDYTDQTDEIVLIITLSVIVSSYVQIFYSIFQGFERIEYQSIGQILNFALLFLGSLIVIKLNRDIIDFAWLFVIANFITILYCLIIYNKKFPKLKIDIDLYLWKPLFINAIPFGLSGIFIIIYTYIDTLMLSFMIPDSSSMIGYYNAAYKLMLAAIVIPHAYFISMYPIMSRLYTSKDSLVFIFHRSIKYMVIIGLPLGAGTLLLAEKIIISAFGGAFAPAAIALQILIWAGVLIFINLALGNLFNSINKQAILTKVTLMASILNILLNLILIPFYNYIGTSFSTVVTELFVLLSCIIILSHTEYKVNFGYLCPTMLRVFIAIAAMSVFIENYNKLNIFILIIISIAIYFSIFLAVGGIDEIDKNIYCRLLETVKKLYISK